MTIIIVIIFSRHTLQEPVPEPSPSARRRDGGVYDEAFASLSLLHTMFINVLIFNNIFMIIIIITAITINILILVIKLIL